MGFGKSKQASTNTSQQTSESGNQAFPFLQQSLGGQVGNAGTGMNAVASLLGLGGAGEQDAAFQRFRDSGSYNFLQGEGIRGINANRASKGLLGSGSTLRGIADYSNNLASNFLNNYMSQLMGLTNSGLQAGQILSSAGGTSKSQGTSQGTSKGSSTNFMLG